MNDSYQTMIDALAACRRILITTHVRPDGDALGSTAAMQMALKSKGIDSTVLLLSQLPPKQAFIYGEYGIPYIEAKPDGPEGFTLDDYDALLVIDTGTWSQLPGLREQIEKWNKPKLVIDHHVTQEEWATEKLVITEAAAAGEIIAGLLQRWKIVPDRAIATALYLAIVSDTGWFQYSNTTPVTMRLAAALMEAGVDTDQLYQRLYQNERAERIVLQSRVLQSLKLLSDGKLAVMSVKNQDLIETGARPADTEAVINIPMQIREVEVSLLFTEPADEGPVRVSLRSKGTINVAAFAERFGGGGHARAAGLKLPGTLQSALEQVCRAMKTKLDEIPGSLSGV